MSQLPPQAIDEFQSLWKQHFGDDLPREEAVARAHQTFTVLRMLIEPLPENKIPPRYNPKPPLDPPL